MIGSTSFDGLSGTAPWRSLLPHLGGLGSLQVIDSIGIAAMIAIIATVYTVGVAGMGPLAGGPSRGELAAAFAHPLIPIAAAYVLAHYATFLLDQAQALFGLASDPFGHGADWFGTAGTTVHPDVLGKTALVLFPDAARARRSQQWMLTVMVGYTGLGLWLLSSLAR